MSYPTRPIILVKSRNVRFSVEQYAEIQNIANSENRKFAKVLRDLITYSLKKYGKKKSPRKDNA